MRKPTNIGGYSCLKCHSTSIYLSMSPLDLKGTLTCLMCGQTEDAAIGIARNGKRITTYSNDSLSAYFKSRTRYEREDYR